MVSHAKNRTLVCFSFPPPSSFQKQLWDGNADPVARHMNLSVPSTSPCLRSEHILCIRKETKI